MSAPLLYGTQHTLVCTDSECESEERVSIDVTAKPCWACDQLALPGPRSYLTGCATWRAEDVPEMDCE